MRKDVKILCLPDKAVSHVPDQILGSVLQYLGEGHSKDEMMAMGRMITWLGLGTRDRSQQFGVKPGYLIKWCGADWIRGKKRTKEEPTIDESRYIEWIVESALGDNYGGRRYSARCIVFAAQPTIRRLFDCWPRVARQRFTSTPIPLGS